MRREKLAQHVSFEQARRMGPPPEGNLAVPVLRHGTMEAELYSPIEVDLQKPHDRDEIYVVAKGRGEFFNGTEVIAVEPGSFIFVPAGTPHYFQNFSEGFSVWVVFYGPHGGEAHVSDCRAQD
ncbi:MAG TPA: cupin domain-containing protein [Burkholderiaceae bacterium]|nr:cupin domain-containing protein [Burkholderiaceae bacterium]